MALVSTVIVGVVALLLAWQRLRQPGSVDRRSQLLTVLMSVATAGGVVGAGEGALRLFAGTEGDVRVFLGTPLMPRRWADVVARYQKVISEKMRDGELSYLAYDDRLGWSPAHDRTSDDGLYSSSAEGIRSPRPGMTMLEPPPPPGAPAPYRIALVGDSYTFGLDVRYEDTWGHQLEGLLGGCVQVRNFGVPGYGVDQAVLRYERDARPWEPDAVILSPIGHDFHRTMSVYTFLSFPGWGFPFSKPRFAVTNGVASVVNVPAAHPVTIFSSSSVTNLPFLELEPGFDPDHWRFRWYDHSMLVRWLKSLYPAWRLGSTLVVESMDPTAVNLAILERFLAGAGEDGVVPILVYLPSIFDLATHGEIVNVGRKLVADIGGRAGVPYADLTAPLRELNLQPLHASLGRGNHYSPEVNRAVAEQLVPVVTSAINAHCLSH
jgi:hypothetical protein